MNVCCSGNPRLVGDPVDVVTGRNVERTLEFRLTGPLPLEFFRHYDSSRHTRLLSLGWGHAHDLAHTLRFDVDGLLYEGPLGDHVGFPPPLRDGEEVFAAGWRLRRRSAAAYELSRAGSPTIEFEFRDASTLARPLRFRRGRHAIELRYDATGRLEMVTDSLGRAIKVLEAADGRLLRLTLLDPDGSPGRTLMAYAYDESGCLTGGVDPYGSKFDFVYDAARRLVRRTDRAGYTFQFEYDLEGRCVSSRGSDGLHAVRLEYRPNDLTTIVTRADGGEWVYTYGAEGELLQVLDPAGGVRQFTTDHAGRLAAEIDPLGNAIHTVYDEAGAPLWREDDLGRFISNDSNNAGPAAHRVASNAAEWECGRRTQLGTVSLPTSGSAAAVMLPRAVQPYVTRRDTGEPPIPPSPAVRPLGPEWWPAPGPGRVFDDFGKLISQRGTSGRIRRWSYDRGGALRQYADFDGSLRRYERESWNLPVREIDPLGASTNYGWTLTERLASVTDAGGAMSEYDYDRKGRLARVRRHGVVREEYRWDTAENLIAKLDGEGRVLFERKVGKAGLLQEKAYASGDTDVFEYDANGRPTAIAGAAGLLTFAYDGFGHRTLDARDGMGVAHEYTSRGSLRRTVVLDRFVISYTEDSDGVTITDAGGARQRLKRLGDGLLHRGLPNGTVEWSQYDAAGRCLMKAIEWSSGGVWARRFRYSGEGDLLQVDDSAEGSSEYAYDAAHRLVRATSASGEPRTFEYDAAGNIVRMPGLRDVAMREGNRLQSANGDAFEHDARNHLASRTGASGTIRYRYDAADRLVGCEGPGLAWEARYDGASRQIEKTVHGVTTRWYWDGDRVAAELGPGGTLRVYVYADALALTPLGFTDYDSPEADPASGRSYFIFSDQIATPVRVEDAAGHEVWRARTAPYGATDVAPDSAVDVSLRYPGHHADAETGLHYNRFRYYSPELGRYLQSDPLGITGGLNLYAYPASPLGTVDVRGLACPECEARARAAGLLGPEEEGTDSPPCPHELDEKFGPATKPWMVRKGEGELPQEAQLVQPGQPLVLEPGTKYIYVIDEGGNMIVAPENGTLTDRRGRPRDTKHTDLSQNGKARVSGELNPSADDPNVFIMDSNSGRYSYAPNDPDDPHGPAGFSKTRTDDHVKNANDHIGQADKGDAVVINETDLR
ncbi:MAG: RHS repeat-associated core domain-containing protein [Gemmatimonadales bacterium]